MPKRYAVIDLGTNTFHLLIAEAGAGQTFQPIFSERHFVKLGAEGVDKLGAAPMARGLETIRAFHRLLTEYKVADVRMIGTEALRKASNGPGFMAEVYRITGFNVELISGEQEAEWIYRGVRQAVELGEENALIMDIGGGSVEFILANRQGMHWRQSFPVGMSVLYSRFHRHDPIRPEESRAIYQFLEEHLQPMWSQLDLPRSLIGAAGPFEIFADFLPHRTAGSHQQNFRAKDVLELHQLLTASTFEQRLALEKLPDARADLIVVALELIYFILKKTDIQEVAVSAFAMKEGIISDMMNKF
jgi:exopolyphosphatase/guanosine-5'-triphosphate,3'-diphosphate pyrophosphatase